MHSAEVCCIHYLFRPPLSLSVASKLIEENSKLFCIKGSWKSSTNDSKFCAFIVSKWGKSAATEPWVHQRLDVYYKQVHAASGRPGERSERAEISLMMEIMNLEWLNCIGYFGDGVLSVLMHRWVEEIYIIIRNKKRISFVLRKIIITWLVFV